jgi:putative FmdB family regulatory protein
MNDMARPAPAEAPCLRPAGTTRNQRSVPMPRYQYRCEACDHEFERPEHMEEHETARPSCPECGSDSVRQVFSSFFAKTSRKS